MSGLQNLTLFHSWIDSKSLLRKLLGWLRLRYLPIFFGRFCSFPGTKCFQGWMVVGSHSHHWANGLAATTGTASSVCCEGPKICEKESKGLSFLFTTTIKSSGFMAHPSGFLSHLFWCSQPSHLLNAYLMAHDRLTAHLFVVAHTGEKSLHLLKDALIECCESNLLNNCAGKMGLAFVAENRKADE